MRNTVYEILGCHTINLRHAALQISFRINCSNKVFAFSSCTVWCRGTGPSLIPSTLQTVG